MLESNTWYAFNHWKYKFFLNLINSIPKEDIHKFFRIRLLFLNFLFILKRESLADRNGFIYWTFFFYNFNTFLCFIFLHLIARLWNFIALLWFITTFLFYFRYLNFIFIQWFSKIIFLLRYFFRIIEGSIFLLNSYIFFIFDKFWFIYSLACNISIRTITRCLNIFSLGMFKICFFIF